jgi:uncharacterized membrane protein (DUF4010 family)
VDFELLGFEFELLQRLAVAAGIGLLIGVERGWRDRDEGAGQRTGGIRTFTLAGLLGGIIGAIARALDDATGAGIIIATGFFAFTAVFAAFRFREVMDEDQYGATTVVAAMATFALGVYALFGDTLLAAAIGVLVAVILAVREVLHGWLHRISWLELRAGLVLAAMTVIALPIIPNEDFGPFGGINPREIWLLALVLAAVSFAGYVAVKLLGATRGMLVAAAAGGLVSSTAVTVDLAGRAGEAKDKNMPAAGITLASAVSYMRALAVVSALNYIVGVYAVAAIGAAVLVALAVTAFYARRGMRAKSSAEFKLRNPFSLRDTLGLALLLGLVLFLTEAIAAWRGPAGALAAAIIAGTVTVDAATFAMARLARGAITPEVAALGVMLAVGANNALKFAIALSRGGSGLTVPLLAGLALPVVVGLIVASAIVFGAANLN